MNPFEFVIAIIALGLLFKLLQSFLPARRSREERRREASDADADAARLAQLEQRIRVLERIVTDERIELKQRFKDL